jgi:hypothetical protein
MKMNELTKEQVALLLEAIGSHVSKAIEFGEDKDSIKKFEELAEMLRPYA